MNFIHESLQELSARLPELEWKLLALNIPLSSKKLPAGLFLEQFEMTAQTCVDEVKADLRALKSQKNERSARYLAERIRQKINVLVRLCQLHSSKAPPEVKANFSIQAMSTRQQWLQTVQQDIAMLAAQERALQSTLIKLQASGDMQALLNLQSDLGEVERRLTLAQETFARATNKM